MPTSGLELQLVTFPTIHILLLTKQPVLNVTAFLHRNLTR
jgi:hypothetical protein